MGDIISIVYDPVPSDREWRDHMDFAPPRFQMLPFGHRAVNRGAAWQYVPRQSQELAL